MLKPYEDRGYAKGHVIPTCLRNHMMLREMREGRGPIYMDTKTALLTTFATLTEEQQKDLESEAWEDFLDMCVGQANLWAATNTAPEERGSEIMPTEPYLLALTPAAAVSGFPVPTKLGCPKTTRFALPTVRSTTA